MSRLFDRSHERSENSNRSNGVQDNCNPARPLNGSLSAGSPGAGKERGGIMDTELINPLVV